MTILVLFVVCFLMMLGFKAVIKGLTIIKSLVDLSIKKDEEFLKHLKQTNDILTEKKKNITDLLWHCPQCGQANVITKSTCSKCFSQKNDNPMVKTKINISTQFCPKCKTNSKISKMYFKGKKLFVDLECSHSIEPF